MPIVHLEPRIPVRDNWTVSVEGLVDDPTVFSIEELRAFGVVERIWDFHCVWGWSRPACRWEGIPVGRILSACSPQPLGGYAVVRAIEGPYAACFTIGELAECILATHLDGELLTPEHGGQLRLVTPPRKWGYKGVKWVGGISLVQTFAPGFWEALVGKPYGDVPAELLEMEDE